MKSKIRFYLIPLASMVAIAVIGVMALLAAAHNPTITPVAIAIATIFSVAISAFAAIEFAREVAVSGADHVSDAVARARAAGARPVMHRVMYLPYLYSRKGQEPWVGLIVWSTETGNVSVPVYGHGARAYEGLAFATHDPIASE